MQVTQAMQAIRGHGTSSRPGWANGRLGGRAGGLQALCLPCATCGLLSSWVAFPADGRPYSTPQAHAVHRSLLQSRRRRFQCSVSPVTPRSVRRAQCAHSPARQRFAFRPVPSTVSLRTSHTTHNHADVVAAPGSGPATAGALGQPPALPRRALQALASRDSLKRVPAACVAVPSGGLGRGLWPARPRSRSATATTAGGRTGMRRLKQAACSTQLGTGHGVFRRGQPAFPPFCTLRRFAMQDSATSGANRNIRAATRMARMAS